MRTIRAEEVDAHAREGQRVGGDDANEQCHRRCMKQGDDGELQGGARSENEKKECPVLGEEVIGHDEGQGKGDDPESHNSHQRFGIGERTTAGHYI